MAAPRNLFLVLTLASSAGVHAALAPVHVAEGGGVVIMFGLSAAVLGATAVAVDRCPRPAAYSLAALVLGTLLAAYLASRLVTLWPLAHTERVDALAATTKLAEAVGLLLALRLLHATAGSRPQLPARPEGAGP